VNERKAAAFKEWIDLLEAHYLNNPAFRVLLMRPMLEMSGAGSRRPVISPSQDIIDWLHRRIASGYLSPNENVAKIYTWKASTGIRGIPRNGWQYIEHGENSVSRLVASCSGSGWCVAESHWARQYLADHSFFLLRCEGKPVVALRTTPDGLSVVECQGQANYSPTEWFVDIELFMRSQGMCLLHRVQKMQQALAEVGDLGEKDSRWWAERARYWPLAQMLAPEDKQSAVDLPEVAGLAQYLAFPRFEQLLADAGLTLSVADWVIMMKQAPANYELVPQVKRDHPAIREACQQGWLDRLHSDDLTRDELHEIPEFIVSSLPFREVFDKSLAGMRQSLRQQPRNASERLSRFDLDQAMVPTEAESAEMALERIVGKLVNNETPDYSNALFADETRRRDDFETLREAGWLQAINSHPPLWFALPGDLSEKPAFIPDTGTVTRVDLDAWVEKVREKPWLLTQQKGVPLCVRKHQRILDAYFDSWMLYVDKAPWRMWVKRGMYSRVYMSYALIASPKFPAALSTSWQGHRRRLYDSWMKGSLRMREMPRFQVAVLRSVGDVKASIMSSQQFNTFHDVAGLQGEGKSAGGADSLYIAEVRNRLIKAGFRL